MEFYVAGLLIGCGFLTAEMVFRLGLRWWVTRDVRRLDVEERYIETLGRLSR